MEIFHYHPITKEFLCKGFADKDPLLPDNWIIPAHATKITPLAYKDFEVCVWRGTGWEVVSDFRGFKFFTQEGDLVEIDSIGITPPDNALIEDPNKKDKEDLQFKKQEHDWVKSEIENVNVELMYHWTKDLKRQSCTEQVWVDYIIALRNYTTVSENGDIEVTSEVRPVVEDFIPKVDDQPDDLVEIEDGEVTGTDSIIYEELNPPKEEA